MAIGVRIRAQHARGVTGPIAIVLPETDSETFTRLLGFIATARRPARVFRALEPALRDLLTAAFKRGKIELRMQPHRAADAGWQPETSARCSGRRLPFSAAVPPGVVVRQVAGPADATAWLDVAEACEWFDADERQRRELADLMERGVGPWSVSILP